MWNEEALDLFPTPHPSVVRNFINGTFVSFVVAVAVGVFGLVLDATVTRNA